MYFKINKLFIFLWNINILIKKKEKQWFDFAKMGSRQFWKINAEQRFGLLLQVSYHRDGQIDIRYIIKNKNWMFKM